MNQLSPSQAPVEGEAPLSGPPPAGPDEEAASSLVDQIIAFDMEPYLGGPLKDIWMFLQDYPLLFAALLVTIGYGIGWVLKYLIHRLLDQIRKHEQSELDYEIVHYLTSPVLQTVVTLAMVLALATLDFPGAIEHLLIKLCFTALLLFWGRAWFRATKVILQALEADRHRFRLFQPRTVPLYEVGIKLMLLSLFVYFFFVIWGIDATAWLASAGIIGIAVGFAARDTLANLISGVSIVADAPYKIGDYIVLDTGERGVVTELGMRSTRLLTRDDVEISIPNAVMGNAKITNESGGPAVEHRIRIPVGVAYGTKPAKVVEVLEQVATSNELTVKEPAPRARMRAFAESSINFELLAWIRMPEQRGLVQHEILMEIERRFAEEGIHIPFPQRDIHIKSGALQDDDGDPPERGE